MGRASTIGSLASVIAFGVGLYLGVTAPFPWPIAWAAGITAGIALSFVTSVGFELVDHRKRYGVRWFGTHVTHDVEDGVTVEDCFSCSGADRNGYRVAWSKDDVFLGMVSERHGGGYSYYCSTCHEDAIEAGLRAGRERDFREWYDGDDHYTEVLYCLRMTYLEREDLEEAEVDFWEWVEMLMNYVDYRGTEDDPREFDDPQEFDHISLSRLVAVAESDESDEMREGQEDDGNESDGRVEDHEQMLEGLPDEYY